MDHGVQCPLPLPVLDAMPTAATSIGNPLSPHTDGARAKDMLDVARSNVAKFLSASPEEVIFTSGGTEANNAAVWGLSAAAEGKGRHIIVSAIEHLSVMDAAERLVRQGWEITRLPVDRYGMIDPDDLRKSLRAQMEIGQVLEVIANDPGIVNDLPMWCKSTGQEFISIEEKDGEYRGMVRKLK